MTSTEAVEIRTAETVQAEVKSERAVYGVHVDGSEGTLGPVTVYVHVGIVSFQDYLEPDQAETLGYALLKAAAAARSNADT